MSFTTQSSSDLDDARARFARRHLATREERAVYRTLISDRTEAWSASEIAERHHSDRDVIARILETFDAAGISEPVDGPEGHRHRWRSEMDYLVGGVGDRHEQVDPVCGMPVSDSSPYVAYDVHGRTTRFCSPLCLAAFLAFRVTFSGPPPPVFREGG